MQALALFEELQIPWHAGTPAGPSNHLVSSQVQCVNALTAMVLDPTRSEAAFGAGEVLEIEPGLDAGEDSEGQLAGEHVLRGAQFPLQLHRSVHVDLECGELSRDRRREASHPPAPDLSG